MQYIKIREFFDAIEKNLSGNITVKGRSTVTYNIEITIYINMSSGKTHKARFIIDNEDVITDVITSHSIVQYLKGQFGIHPSYDSSALYYTDDGKGMHKNEIKSMEIIRFIDIQHISDMTYVVKFHKKENA